MAESRDSPAPEGDPPTEAALVSELASLRIDAVASSDVSATLPDDSVSSVLNETTGRHPDEHWETLRWSWYHGLSPLTPLVASSRQLNLERSHNGTLVRKRIFAISPSNSVNRLWREKGVGALVREKVTRLLPGATSILVVGLGPRQENPRTTLWIGVANDTTTRAQATTAISALSDVLRLAGLLSVVDTEVHISERTSLAAGPRLPLSEPFNRYADPFTSAIGCELSPIPQVSTNHIGTLGLFVDAGPGPERERFALTCQHVVSPMDSGAVVRPTDPGPRQVVAQLSNDRYKKKLKDLEEARADAEAAVARYEKKLNDALPGTTPHVTNLRYMENSTRQRDRVQAVQQHLSHIWPTPEHRVIGSVYAHPPVRFDDPDAKPSWDLSEPSWYLDWALIRLDPDAYEDASINVLSAPQAFIDTMVDPHERRLTDADADSERPRIGPFDDAEALKEERLIRLSGEFTPEQARQENRVLVMRGATSGRRLGVNTVIEAWTRSNERAGPGMTAWSTEIAVVGLDGNAFTDKGDSGAVVFDRAGAILGIHTGGFRGLTDVEIRNRHFDAQDIALITPIGCILADMRRQGIVNPSVSPAHVGKVVTYENQPAPAGV